MTALLPLIAVPLIVMLAAKFFFGASFTLKELAIGEAGMALLLGVSFAGAKGCSMADTEYLNGRVSSKDHYDRSCSHSYDCPPCDTCCSTCTNSDGSTYDCNCHDCNCATCYDHNRDYFWDLSFDMGAKLDDYGNPSGRYSETVTVETCGDCRGRKVPVWENAYVGEPASRPHLYTNYLLADENSLMVDAGDGSVPIPANPDTHSLYKRNAFINMGTQAPEAAWNAALAEINADLGNPKQVDIIVIATRSTDPGFAEDFPTAWFHKNQLAFMFGAPDGKTIEWARVQTISEVHELKIIARDEFPGQDLTDTETMADAIRRLTDAKYTRTPMAEWEYLAASAKPPTWALVLLWFIAIVGTVGYSLFAHSQDIFGDERWTRSRF